MDDRFDGDMMSMIFLLSDDSVAEIKKLHASAAYYLDPTGKIAFSAGNDTINYVLKNILS